MTTGHAAITVPGACVFAAVVCWTCMCIRGDGVCGALFRHAHPHWLRTQTPLPAPSPPPPRREQEAAQGSPDGVLQRKSVLFPAQQHHAGVSWVGSLARGMHVLPPQPAVTQHLHRQHGPQGPFGQAACTDSIPEEREAWARHDTCKSLFGFAIDHGQTGYRMATFPPSDIAPAGVAPEFLLW